MGREATKVPWWKNRRRLFYIVIISILIGGPLLSWIWYDQNFPLPQWKPKENDPFGSSQFPGYQLMLPYQDRLLRWKLERLTSQLKLAGSTWEDDVTGAVIEFRSDGRIFWKEVPMRIPPGDPFMSSESFDFAKLLDGCEYRFLPTNGGGLRWNESENSQSTMRPNIEFPGRIWRGFVGFDGKTLGLYVSDNNPNWAKERDFTLFLTRRRDSE